MPSLAKLGLVAAATSVALLGVWIADLLDLNKVVTYNDNQCVLLPDIGPGSEDIAVVDNNLALVSAGDLDRMVFQSGNPPREGGIFAVRFVDGEGGGGEESKIHTERLVVEGFPTGKGGDDMTFNPHGISFSNRTQRVYAVNHDCGDQHVYEGIEVFKLVREGQDLKLIYERSIKSPSFPLGGMNDVVEGAVLGEIYATQWLPSPIPNQCIGKEGFVGLLTSTYEKGFTRKTKVHRCVYDPKEPAEAAASCSVVAEGFRSANGIASDPEKEHFFVVDPPDKALHTFTRLEDGSLRREGILKLPHTGDNVEFDAASGRLTMSATPLVWEILKRMDGDASVQVGGGMISALPLPNGTYAVREELMHDGSKLSCASSAVFVHGKILLGSPPSDGVLVCPIPVPLKSYALELES